MDYKYEKMVNAVSDAIGSGAYGVELIKTFLMHLSKKVYQMGVESVSHREPIPITDLTMFPEIFDRVRDRWNNGKAC